MDTIRSGSLVVDVWSDVVCPFCYLGDTVLERALEAFPHRDEVEVRYHSFLLMPDLPVGTGFDLPFFVFDDTYAISGAQPEELFARALERIRDDRAGASS